MKKAIIEKFERDNDISYEPNEILVSVGGKQSFFNLAQAFINPGGTKSSSQPRSG